MRLRRPALARTLLAAALSTTAVLTAGAAGAAPVSTTEVAGSATQTAAAGPVLTMSGSTSGYSTFYLARSSTITINGVGTTQGSVAGNGRSVGLVLNRIGAGAGDHSFALFTSNGCYLRGCRPDAARLEIGTGRPFVQPESGPSTVTLPPGRYNATLVADGAPVTARLQLSGLTRSLTLHPKAAAKVSYNKVTGVTPEQPGHVYSTGGRSYNFSSTTYFLTQNSSRTAAGGAQAEGVCVINGEAPPNNVYLPRCPTADPSDDRASFEPIQVLAPDETNSYELGSVFLLGGLPARQPFAIGSYVVSAVPLLETHRLQLAVQVPLCAS